MRYLLGLLALCLALYAGWNVKGCFTKKEKAPVVQVVNPLTDTLKHWKDSYGVLQAQVAMEIESRQNIETRYKQKYDSICKRLHLKDKQLEDMSQVIAQANGYFEAPLQIVHDTVTGQVIAGVRAFNWSDPWTHITGIVDSEKVNVNYSVALNFSTASSWTRKHHFGRIGWGKKIYSFNAWCDNPNISITGLKAIKIN